MFFWYLGSVDVGLNLQIRVVVAFVGEVRALQAYSSTLRTAQWLQNWICKGNGIVSWMKLKTWAE